MKLIFWKGDNKRKWSWNYPCSCGCDYRDNPNLFGYYSGGLYFFGFTLMFYKKEKHND